MVARRVDGAANKEEIGIDGGRVFLRLPRLASRHFGDGRRDLSGVSRRAVKNDISFHAAIMAYYYAERDGHSLREAPFFATMIA